MQRELKKDISKADSLKTDRKVDSVFQKQLDTVANNSATLPRTQAEERELLIKMYDQIKTIDTVFIGSNDTLHFFLKYYCKKENTLTIPKSFDMDKKSPKDFVTHPFASDIILVRNRDTVLKKQITAGDLNPFFEDKFGGNIKKYGSISMPYLSKRNKEANQILLIFTIGIPSTDIGIGVPLKIEKDGHYSVAPVYHPGG